MALAIDYTITFVNEYGEVHSDIAASSYTTSVFTAEEIPELYMPGYIFHGWYNDWGTKAIIGNRHSSIGGGVKDGGIVTLTAKWERLHYVTDTPLKNIGNAIRDLWGIEDTLTLEEMVSYIDIPQTRIAEEKIENVQKFLVQIGNSGVE